MTTKKTRQERIENGTLVPNSFQHPNLYVDWIHYYLTPEEVVVLDKAVREILGWEENISDRKARIALSIFQYGKVSRKDKDRQLCLGCGLGLHAIRTALAALNKYGILIKEGEPTQEGQMWRLQDKAHEIDLEGLEKRREEWDEKNLERTKRATRASLASRGVTSDVRGNVGRNPNQSGLDPEQTTTPGVPSDVSLASDVQTLVPSDVNNETQRDLYTRDNNNDLLWQPVLESLELLMTQATFDTWFRSSELIAIEDDGTWTVDVHNPYAVDWIDNRLQKPLNHALEQHAPGTKVKFVAREAS